MKDTGLYIHIPFCKMKCYYCDFPSFSGKESLMVDYARALSLEINQACSGKRIKSIFIGGGTPTYLSLEGWEIIAEALRKIEINKEDFEFTIEGNPKTFKKEQLAFFKAMGVNRISMGLQAAQSCHLESLGRIHTYKDFEESFNMVREAGIENINVDLMFGLPGQTIDEWKETLRKVREKNPQHISCYSLIIEEGTKFYNLYEADKLILPSEEQERKMYSEALSYLKDNGYEHYEISNFAKPGHRCRHNLIYWNMEAYIGCGSSAHSYVDGKRYSNEVSVEKYISMMNAGDSSVKEYHVNSEADEMEEFIFLGLRKMEGISINEFSSRFKKDIYEVYSQVIEKHKKLGLLQVDGDRMFLTERGIELSNQVMSDFILTA